MMAIATDSVSVKNQDDVIDDVQDVPNFGLFDFKGRISVSWMREMSRAE